MFFNVKTISASDIDERLWVTDANFNLTFTLSETFVFTNIDSYLWERNDLSFIKYSANLLYVLLFEYERKASVVGELAAWRRRPINRLGSAHLLTPSQGYITNETKCSVENLLECEEQKSRNDDHE